MKNRLLSHPPELLEARIAPASITYVDAGGDTATITSSKGTAANLMAAATFSEGDGHLVKLTLGSIFQGADISITTEGGGRTLLAPTVNVDFISATGIDLHNVTVQGELGQIKVGDANPGTPALNLLEVKALGVTAAPESHIFGRLTTLTVNGNVGGALFVEGGANGLIGTAHITGSLVGGAAFGTGSIITTGAIASLTIDGNLAGGDGERSGSILTGLSIGKFVIGGNLLGDDGKFSGSIGINGGLFDGTINGFVKGGTNAAANDNASIAARAGIDKLVIIGALQGGAALDSGRLSATLSDINNLRIDGGVRGGAGEQSGAITAAGVIHKAVIGATEEGMTGGAGLYSGAMVSGSSLLDIKVNGSVKGGNGASSAVIAAAGAIGSVVVEGDLVGGDAGTQSGAIGCVGALNSVTVNGDVIGGDANSSGQIVSATSINTVQVNGDLVGGSGFESGSIGTIGFAQKITVTGIISGDVGFRSGSILVLGNLGTAHAQSIQGGSGSFSGRIASGGAAGLIEVTGAVTAGTAFFAGNIGVGGIAYSITVGGDIVGTPASGTPGLSAGTIACVGPVVSIAVGGSVFGGATNRSGSISSSGSIGSVSVDGSLVGNDGDQSGSIFTESGAFSKLPLATAPGLGKVTVLGDIGGGDGEFSGSIDSANSIVTVQIGRLLRGIGPVGPIGDMNGGTGFSSGSIYARGSITEADIAGSLSGDGAASGSVTAGGNIGRMQIDGSVTGNGASYSSSINNGPQHNGQINALGVIGTLTILGNLNGGRSNFGGSVVASAINQISVNGDVTGGSGLFSGYIQATTGNLTLVDIGGTLGTADGPTTSNGGVFAQREIVRMEVGAVAGNALFPVRIAAAGVARPSDNNQALAIGTLEVEGAMSFTQVLAGYNANGAPVNGNAQIGTVEVGTDGPQSNIWFANDIVAGLKAGQDGIFGTSDDQRIDAQGASPIISQIAQVVVHGTIRGTTTQHGIEAEFVRRVFFDDGQGSVAESVDNVPFNNFFAVRADPSRQTFITETPPFG